MGDAHSDGEAQAPASRDSSSALCYHGQGCEEGCSQDGEEGREEGGEEVLRAWNRDPREMENQRGFRSDPCVPN